MNYLRNASNKSNNCRHTAEKQWCWWCAVKIETPMGNPKKIPIEMQDCSEGTDGGGWVNWTGAHEFIGPPYYPSRDNARRREKQMGSDTAVRCYFVTKGSHAYFLLQILAENSTAAILVSVNFSRNDDGIKQQCENCEMILSNLAIVKNVQLHNKKRYNCFCYEVKFIWKIG